VGGKLIFHVFGALAEFERDVIRERTQAGLAAARARGRMGGRPKKLAGATKVAMAQALYDDQAHSIADICKTLGISRMTLYRSIRITQPTERRDASAPQHVEDQLGERRLYRLESRVIAIRLLSQSMGRGTGAGAWPGTLWER
jgi:DNA invertase Pin-like site-specific DNA recombinase